MDERFDRDVNRQIVEKNEQKFQDPNPITRRLVMRFMERVAAEVSAATSPGDRVLDVGAGEGTMTSFLSQRLPDREFVALEYEPEGVERIRETYSSFEVVQGSAYELPYAADEFELVTSFEVLEHLESPGRALDEMGRVAARGVVLTVPFEPWFRVGNVLRGKHLGSLGNTPGHINHWGRRSLRHMVAEHFDRAQVESLFPWLLASAR